MSLLHPKLIHHHPQPILTYTISQMTFKQPTHTHTHPKQSQHHSPHQLPRAMSYKSEKQKKTSRLKQQVQAFRVQKQGFLMGGGQSQMVKTWSSPFIPSKWQVGGVGESIQSETLCTQHSQRLSARKKLPTLIKYDIDIKRNHHTTAKRNIKPSPAELLTRKLHCQPPSTKTQHPSKTTRPKPKTSHPKVPILKQRYLRPVVVRLSGWQLQASHEQVWMGC